MIGEPEALLRLALAAAAGAIIGLEREERDKPAGVRTFAIVAMGSAMFALIGLMAFGSTDAASRIAAQVVTGIGFLGAGTILHHRGNVHGLTTAAGIWGSAAVGMGMGYGLYILSAGGTVILLAVLRLVGRLMVDADVRGSEPGPTAGDAGEDEDDTGEDEADEGGTVAADVYEGTGHPHLGHDEDRPSRD
jgi:putative Mg2+ transporter-C (MgtC) family protein